MPIFDLYCKECGHKEDNSVIFGNIPHCPECGGEMDKDWRNMRVGFVPDIPEHFNESLGMVVKGRRDLKTKLWETNSRTDDIAPSGGLTPEERAERGNIIIGGVKTKLDRRGELGWGQPSKLETDGIGIED